MNYAKPHSKTRAEAEKCLFFGVLRNFRMRASDDAHPIGASMLCGSATD